MFHIQEIPEDSPDKCLSSACNLVVLFYSMRGISEIPCMEGPACYGLHKWTPLRCGIGIGFIVNGKHSGCMCSHGAELQTMNWERTCVWSMHMWGMWSRSTCWERHQTSVILLKEALGTQAPSHELMVGEWH